MKTHAKLFWIAVIAAVIAAGLSACISISPAPEPDEETLALRNTMRNATWERIALAAPPSTDGVERLPSNSEEGVHFQSALARNEHEDGREITSTHRGVESKIRLMYLAPDTWYALTAPEIPGVTYYYYRSDRGAISTTNVYKSMAR